ncbi:hypothetical protein, partial [Yersinia pestis]
MWVLPINSNPTVLHPPMVDRVYIDRQIDELELYFCPDTGKCKKLTTEMRVRNEIYKNLDYFYYFLEKSYTSVALSLLIVEQAWTNTHQPVSRGNIKPEYRLDDYRRESLCEFAIREILKTVDEAIISQPSTTDSFTKKKNKKAYEDIISMVSYLVGLTKDKIQGAKQRYGSDPITQVLFQEFNKRNIFHDYSGNEQDVLKDAMNGIVYSCYKFYSEKEKLPSVDVIKKIMKEVPQSINYPDSETAAYRLISKAIIDPMIIDINYEKHCHLSHLNALARTLIAKDIPITHNRKYKHYLTDNLNNKFIRLFLLDKTFDIRKSELYQRVEQHLR